MTRAEYLAELGVRLQSLPQDERDSAMRYYVEYFDDAGEGNEQQVIEQLGSPSKLAQQLAGEAQPIKLPKVRGKKSPLTWVLIVLGSPIWISLLAAGLGVLVSLLAAAFTVLLSLAMLAVVPLMVSVAMLLGGGFGALTGMMVGLSHVPTALWMFGVGLVFVALGALVFQPCIKVMQRALRGIFTASGWIMKKLRRLRRSV